MHESANDAKAILQLVTINTGVGNYADGHSVYLTELEIVFCIVQRRKIVTLMRGSLTASSHFYFTTHDCLCYT